MSSLHGFVWSLWIRWFVGWRPGTSELVGCVVCPSSISMTTTLPWRQWSPDQLCQESAWIWWQARYVISWNSLLTIESRVVEFVLFTVVSTAFMPIQIGFRHGDNYSVEDVDLESVESTLSLKRRGSCLRFLRVWFQRRLSKLKSILASMLCGPWFTSSWSLQCLPTGAPPVSSKLRHGTPLHSLFYMKLKLVSQSIIECNYSYKYQDFPVAAHINTHFHKTKTGIPEVGLNVWEIFNLRRNRAQHPLPLMCILNANLITPKFRSPPCKRIPK